MKIALIGSGVSSGGLVSMLSEFLSYHPGKGIEVSLFCSDEFLHQYPGIHPDIKVQLTDALTETKRSGLLSLSYRDVFIKQINEYNPDVVFYITGSSKNGLELYNSYIVLNNQLYTNYCKIFKQRSLKVSLTTFVFALKFRQRAKKISHIFFSSEYSYRESSVVLPINDYKIVSFACNSNFYVDKSISGQEIKNTVELLNIGSIIPYKNQLVVIDALKVLKEKGIDFRLTFIGKKLSKGYYKDCITKIKMYDLDERIDFIEWLPQKGIIEKIDSCDIFINSSDTDTCATAVEEGMARCKPVIASDTPFNREMVRDGGLYFSLDEPSMLADAIIKYINDADFRNVMAIKGYELSKKWTLKDTARAYYDKIISDALNNKKRNECR